MSPVQVSISIDASTLLIIKPSSKNYNQTNTSKRSIR